MKSGTGVGIPTILTLIFLVLKLTDNIDWSWWWIFSPLWISVCIMIIFIIIFLIIIKKY
jgi:hypothetical protein